MGYAVWLIPDDETVTYLQDKIKMLCNRCNTPEFPAHITLVSGLKDNTDILCDRLNKLADMHKPFSLSITRAGYRDTYFQNLFIHVEENTALKSIRKNAFKTFNQEQLESKTFMPHFSLLYGHLAQEEKEWILMDIGHEFNIQCTIKSVQLIKTEGKVEQWERICTQSLT